MPKSPIVGAFAMARSRTAVNNTLVNMGVEVVETRDAFEPGFLFLASGLDHLYTVGDGPIRGALPLGPNLYVVSGSDVYSLTVTGEKTLLGSIGDQNANVSMFENGRQLMIVDGVGGWLVPGGYPLTSGTIGSPGGLYSVGDTITLAGNGGVQNAYPIVRVTSVSANPVTTFTLPNAGTTYATASNVATTNIQPKAGGGTGLTVNITAAGASISAIAVNAGGSGYAVGDTGVVQVGSRDAVYRVTGVSSGAVTSLILLNRGAAYTSTTGAATVHAAGIPINVGSGFTVNITAAGPITASSVNVGGFGYAIGATGLISGGTADATYLVTAIGPFGSVTGFSFVQGGAAQTQPTSFTQLSTSGSGSGFTLTSPGFGSNVGLVPVTLPFPNPLQGDISDGFGVLVFSGQNYLAASAYRDLSTWDPLSFGIVDQHPGNTISVKVIHDQVCVSLENDTEVWVNQGQANFPFQPITSVHIEFGSAATFSVAIANEDLIWLSRNTQGQGIVVRAGAYIPKPISTQALVNEFSKYPNLGDAIAYARQEGQHVYYVITFPEAGKTWQYDLTSSDLVGYPVWSELAAFDNGALNRHWGNAFTIWKGSGTVTPVTTAYQAQSVTITAPTMLDTPSGLNGLAPLFSTAVFSLWLKIPSGSTTGVVFGNQGGSAVPGLQISIQNDGVGDPQITIEARDVAGDPIVDATYEFSTWAAWVNLLISIDTTNNVLQVYANTLVSNALVETLLTETAITWSSTNPIAADPDAPWLLTVV